MTALCVPVTHVQSIADRACSPALPGGKRAVLHDSQANAKISKIGPRGKCEALDLAPNLRKWRSVFEDEKA